MIQMPRRHRPSDPTITSFSQCTGAASMGGSGTAPSSGTITAETIVTPLYLLEPYTVRRAFWLNGATVGTDRADVGAYLMTDPVNGRFDIIRSTGPVTTAGTNVCQESTTWKVSRANITSGGDSTDQDTYTTASVTLKAGRLYLLSVENSHASAAPAVSSITGGGTWAVTDATNGTTTFNGGLNRLSVWYLVPTADYTGTLSISFGASSGVTGACWALTEMAGQPAAGFLVQVAKATGNSTTPSVTLSAFAASANCTFGAIGIANTSGVTPGTGFTELADATAATPAQGLETEWRVDNDTSVDATVTSGQWAIIGIEVAADASSPFILPPSYPGAPNVYIAFAFSGTTDALFRQATNGIQLAATGVMRFASTTLPSSFTGPSQYTTARYPVWGYSDRTILA